MIANRKCECQWDIGPGTVLSLCAEHHAYVQKHYVQVTGTMFRLDEQGNMRDYETIPNR